MNPVPGHVAIIMDGNGRWAKGRGLPRIEGHRRGVEVTEEIVEKARDLGVKYLTLYAFSDENWERPKDEVVALMQLLSYFVLEKCGKMLENGVRLRTIGEVDKLPGDVCANLKDVMEKTKICNNMDLILALSYGSQQEITRAVNRLINDGKRDITTSDIDAALDTGEMPPPDLIIRTSGEIRLSNFMLWQAAYSEFYFTDVLWPDFNESEFEKAIKEYKGRERRFGKVKED